MFLPDQIASSVQLAFKTYAPSLLVGRSELSPNIDYYFIYATSYFAALARRDQVVTTRTHNEMQINLFLFLLSSEIRHWNMEYCRLLRNGGKQLFVIV